MVLSVVLFLPPPPPRARNAKKSFWWGLPLRLLLRHALFSRADKKKNECPKRNVFIFLIGDLPDNNACSKRSGKRMSLGGGGGEGVAVFQFSYRKKKVKNSKFQKKQFSLFGKVGWFRSPWYLYQKAHSPEKNNVPFFVQMCSNKNNVPHPNIQKLLGSWVFLC